MLVVYVLAEALAQDRLPDLEDPSIAQALCLPPKARSSLMKAEQPESLKQEPPVPPGYARRRSKTTGLYLLTPLAGVGAEYFDWRDVLPAYRWSCEMPELPAPKLEKEEIQVEGQHPYLVTVSLGNFWCRLCQETALEDHTESARHCRLEALWQRCVALVRSRCQELEMGLMPSQVDDDEAVLSAWRADLFSELLDLDASHPEDAQQVPALFARFVELHWPSRWCELQPKLERLLRVAEQPEPELVRHAVPPELGVDLPCFPSITKPLFKESTEKDVSNFTVLDLLTHGLELQDRGIFRCWFCETEVSLEGLARHILPFYKEGQSHKWSLFVWNANAAYIKEHGWGLPHEVRGKRIVCQCNPGSEVSGLVED